MKAIIEFDLPTDNQEFRNANNADDMMSILWDIDLQIRNKLKYCDENDAAYDALVEFLEGLRATIPNYVREG